PTPPAFHRDYLLSDGDQIVVPPEIATSSPPRELILDRGPDGDGLSESWRSWWVRSVDLFGRVSMPSAPYIAKVEDNSPPPPPALILAEFAQPDVAALQPISLAQSTFSREWLDSDNDNDAFVVSWAWTPELDEQ